MTHNSAHTIRLYDLVVESGCTISPFVWRAKYAIAHKGFEIESVPVSFTGIPKILNGQYTRLPVIDDQGVLVSDSIAIADYLDRTYPERPALFASAGERNLTLFFDGWLWRDVIHRMFSCYVLDNVEMAMAEDRDYLRESRERLFFGGRKLAEVVAGREERIPAIRESLQPLRVALAKTPWLGGARPGYVDYCALSCFLWAASINTMPPLERHDPLFDWINRGFDLYGGLGRATGMRPLAA